MYAVPVKTLLEAGSHFGHRASRWNPKMAPYIFGKRNLIHIIDLKQTLRGLIKACMFLQELSAQGQSVLFVGTKRQAQSVIQNEGQRLNMPFVAERWLGGTLTNFEVVRMRLRRLDELEAMETDGTYGQLKKKEVAMILREKRKIHRNLHGIRKMVGMPGAMIVVDPRKEKTAVKEARKMGVPIIAVLDTDCDPELIDIPIPGNDDALRSIQVLVGKLGEAITNGQQAYQQYLAEEQKRRQEEESRVEAQKKVRAEEQKKKQSEQAELDKILKKAREERSRRQAVEEGAQARLDHEIGVTPAAGAEAAPNEVSVSGDTKPGPLGPEPV
jgi:small subunit ribosomal protein S2